LVHVEQRLHYEVLAHVGEALAELLQLDEATRVLITRLDVLSRSQLALLLNALVFHVVSDFMNVRVAVVLADFADAGLSARLRRLQESLFDLEDLFLHAVGRVDVEHAWQSHEQELLVMCLGRRQADRLEHGIDASLNFAFETIGVVVVNDSELRVAYPRINQLFVECYRLVNRLIARFIVDIGVEGRCAVGSRHHVDDSFVPTITQLDRAPVGLIEECLPDLIRCVCLAIHNTTIAENDCGLVALKRGL